MRETGRVLDATARRREFFFAKTDGRSFSDVYVIFGVVSLDGNDGASGGREQFRELFFLVCFDRRRAKKKVQFRIRSTQMHPTSESGRGRSPKSPL